ncbi:AAA family ATPase [Variovorax sp. J2P1-59]|uniref:McrB family protein n=1 Tax=Variovorax flavidus TaxID=3053501 RepID=UPI002577FBB8|nr:AAA family ATPase [Variovorax sp. J2P1-59]MDM0078700.1 AAA family ATPase [Variovorax sp. J2P1-59]
MLWRTFDSLTTTPQSMADQPKAWLLTWNPEKYTEGGDGDAGRTIDLVVNTQRRWSCGSSQPMVGDAVYLVRLGVGPRGIIARGTVSRAPFHEADWGDSSRQKRYIEFSVAAVRTTCAAGLLPMLLMTSAMGAQTWSPQQSGIQIADGVAAQLDALWKAGKGVHSLRQFASWCDADASYNTTWLPGYQEATLLAESVQNDPSLLDDAALQRLWRDLENGVSSVSPGGIPHAKFAAAKSWLAQITHRIAAAPDRSTYAYVLDGWKTDGGFDTVLSSVIHRVFAAFAPELYTTVLNTDKCKVLLRILGDQFQLPQPPNGRDWFDLNGNIKKAMAEGGLDPDQLLKNNISIWRVLEAQPARSKLAEPQATSEAQAGESHEQVKSMESAMSIPLNQILFGPPGTGKTYHTITKTLEILAPELAGPGASRDAQVATFNRFREDGQVVFCTFHQSFAYEDFVEGLRADAKDGRISYDVADGVFKKLCLDAEKGLTTSTDALAKALEKFDDEIAAAEDESVTLTTVKMKRRFTVRALNDTSYRVMPEESRDEHRDPDTVYRVFVRDLHKFYENDDPRAVHNSSYVRPIIEHLKARHGLPAYSAPAERPKFVMIIDEINRGNVSRIFGELITLIEGSKRKGAEGAEVILPYSKKKFSVPDNVYLVGTMNTADKSLATVDIALRRRFHFTEMQPDASLLDGVKVGAVDVGQLLRKINERIEVLLDRDHCIGHASFMPLKVNASLPVLQEIFQRQVLPLLQEYFFEDWQRIAWVLNDHRKSNDVHRFLQKPKTDVAALFGNEVEVPQANVRWKINVEAFLLEASYLGVIDATPAGPGEPLPAASGD